MNQLLLSFQYNVLPEADPLALPAYPWIFLFLLFLTFTLHMLLMNLTVGGSAFLVLASFSNSERMQLFSKFLSKLLPITLAFTITMGVAPLLFIQVLYGQIFFTTSIIMGWWWLILLLLLIVAYYGLYLFQIKYESSNLVRKLSPTVSFILLLAVGLLFSMNFKLFFRFNEWFELGKSGSAGWLLNLTQPQVLPSWISHMLTALAAGGLLLVFHGWVKRKENTEYGAWAANRGAIWFVVFTILQLAATFWLLSAVGSDLNGADIFAGGTLTIYILIGLSAYALAALMMLWIAFRKTFGLPAVLSALFVLVGIVMMTLRRADLREQILNNLKGFDIGAMKVVPQWDTISIFAVLLLMGLGIVVWMAWAVMKGKGATEAERQ